MNKSVNFKKISKHRTPEESPGYLLWRVSTQWRTTIEKTLKTFDLTHPQFVVLACIAWLCKQQENISQAEVSRAAGLDPNTISQIVRGLEKKKLIKRSQKIDERSKNPALTQKAAVILSQALPAVEHADAEFFEKLSLLQQKSSIEIFRKLLCSGPID